MKVSRMMRAWAGVAAVCVVLGGCSDAGLMKPDGRERFAEVASKDNPEKCTFSVGGRAKRELTITCADKPVAALAQRAPSQCKGYEAVGFELVHLKGQDGAQRCEVHSACACNQAP